MKEATSAPWWLWGQIKQCSIAQRSKLSGTREEIAYVIQWEYENTYLWDVSWNFWE